MLPEVAILEEMLSPGENAIIHQKRRIQTMALLSTSVEFLKNLVGFKIDNLTYTSKSILKF